MENSYAIGMARTTLSRQEAAGGDVDTEHPVGNFGPGFGGVGGGVIKDVGWIRGVDMHPEIVVGIF